MKMTDRNIYNYPDKLIAKLKRRMLEQDMEQQELAKRAGISAVYLSNIFTGKSMPSIYIFCLLANALDLKLELKGIHKF